ncbi:MAG: GNAT family N-acetyltransferase [Hyphomicrobiales bacterium]|nr:MAG: GNAT family N-acetyltransferase [Hyphomicrobiales bacterium]
MEIRPAAPDDAFGMSLVLAEIFARKQSDRPSNPEHVAKFYINPPDQVSCSVAIDEKGEVLGFQSLKIAREGNPFDLPTGWGIIGTYVGQKAARRGVGSALFAASLKAARNTGLSDIDATIGAENEQGLHYYNAMGFQTYRTKPGAVCKCFSVADTADLS